MAWWANADRQPDDVPVVKKKEKEGEKQKAHNVLEGRI